jgi:hypothetical protein
VWSTDAVKAGARSGAYGIPEQLEADQEALDKQIEEEGYDAYAIMRQSLSPWRVTA